MRKFIFGIAIGIAATFILVIGVFLILSEKVERGLFGSWEEREEPKLELTLYSLGKIELRDTFGMSTF